MKKHLFLILLSALSSLISAPSTAFAQEPFRGAWIATVANIDWPTEDAVGQTEIQQQQLIWLLDSLHSIGINAVVFQVRPTADALYLSELEPTSHWLTGKQGYWQQQEPYDPLRFLIDQAHLRSMQVHVWINPYRAVHSLMSDTACLAPEHLLHRHPEWFWRYGGQWYFNPALKVTRDWLCLVVEDIVCRYRVDAVHMDDYFYPYPSGKTPLPDMEDFLRDPRGFEHIEDWRRDNVSLTIEALSSTIHHTRPDVQFGISPFGVWRNATPLQLADSLLTDSQGLPIGSATQAGITNYDHLYADILLWIRKGWIDYVVPQLYWEIGKRIADYEILAHWWAEAVRRENEQSGRTCHLYIGLAPYRLGGAKEPQAWRTGCEIARQIRLNRNIEGIEGECFYSARPLLRNPQHVCDSIRAIYQE